MAGDQSAPKVDFVQVLKQLEIELEKILKFRDLFFENHPIEMAPEKNNLLKEKVTEMSEKINNIDETEIPIELRAKYQYLKGRCYNMVPEYDPRALECFSKAVKLNPNMIEAWIELGESYWKNMNIKESQACLEGSLKRQRHPITLRSLSVLLRQSEVADNQETKNNILRSVDYAKEAVSMNPKDGVSWTVLGNAYLCQFFMVEQCPNTLKLAMSAYKQAWTDAVARGTPDLPYNKGVTLNYEERYEEAMECFALAHRLDPAWAPPAGQLRRLAHYLRHVDDVVRCQGRLKGKRLQHMLKSMEPKLYGEYLPGQPCKINNLPVTLQRAPLAELQDGANDEKVVLGRVVASYHSENTVPFTFAIVDESLACVAVNVYNWADGRGVIIGDAVCLPQPRVSTHVQTTKFPDFIETSEFINGNTKSKPNKMYNFRSIRVNSPLRMLVNGRRPAYTHFARTKVSTTLETC